ncbi:MAG: threonine--tRNA ligase, partial [Alphaproteobacteria bacterium]
MPEISLEVPGRGVVPATAGQTAREVLERAGVLGDAVAALLNGRPVDLSTKVEGDGRLAPVAPSSPQGLEVLRHSTAHLMAQAVKRLFPAAQITIGPVIEDGFYY